MATQPTDGILEEFRKDFLEAWHQLPNKGFFLVLLVAWLALFQFFGNATLGYINTSSLLSWMWSTYTASSDAAATDDAHGKLIPLVVLGLLWWKRKQLLALPLRVWAPALALVLFALLLHIAGYMIQQPKVSIIAMFVGIYGLTGLAWGYQWLKESFFPFILFAFSVPLGWSAVAITFRLRVLVCRIVEVICGYIFQIDVLVEGTAIMDPNHRFQYEVAAACSGMRSLIAIIAISVIYSMVSFHTWWRRALLMASAVPLAVLGNVFRMLAIIVAADLGGQEAGMYVHDGGPGGILSYLPYIPAFAGLMLLGHWLREPAPAKAPPTAPGPDSAPTISGQPVNAVP